MIDANDPKYRDAVLRLIDWTTAEVKAERSTKMELGMTREQILGRLAKREVAFRVWANCTDCVYYKPDSFGSCKCVKPENEETCRGGFESWMRKEIE